MGLQIGSLTSGVHFGALTAAPVGSVTLTKCRFRPSQHQGWCCEAGDSLTANRSWQ